LIGRQQNPLLCRPDSLRGAGSFTSDGKETAKDAIHMLEHFKPLRKRILLITPVNREIIGFRKKQFNNFVQICMPYLSGFKAFV
jgi:hypothetical protein